MSEKFTIAEESLLDIMDGCKGWYDIQEKTGLDDERCQEIYDYYLLLKNRRKKEWTNEFL
jgi:hypothetical protein